MPAPDRLKSKCQNYRTPLDLAQDVRGVFGGSIGLDPCTEPGNHLRAERFYTVDGLSQPWEDRTWCNPPYDQLAEWCIKLLAEAQRGHRIGLLCSVTRTEQAWFQHVIRNASCFQLQLHKLRHSEGKPAMLASWVLWFNVDPDTVSREMGWRGVISVPW